MLRERIIKTASIIGGLLVFIFSVTGLYIDSNFGFSTELLELNYSAFPKCVYAIIFVIFCPLIVYVFLEQLLEFIISKISHFNSIKARKLN